LKQNGVSENRESVQGAFAWTLGLSVCLGWLPVLGPSIAGYVGGRKARKTGSAVAAAVVPAALWTASWIAISYKDIKIGGQSIVAGPLFYLGPVSGTSILGGALIGSISRGAKTIGALIFLGGLGYFGINLSPVIRVVNELRGSNQVHYEPAKNKTCPDNLKQLYTALQFYADSWEDRFPPADNWMTAIKDNVPKDEWLHCPEVSKGAGPKYGYSMSPSIGSKKRAEIKDKAATPMIYDSADLSVNAHAGPDSVPKPGRHTGKNNVLYADGTVKLE
jgi:prepilin-type processing-associated H-X9-DG protein